MSRSDAASGQVPRGCGSRAACGAFPGAVTFHTALLRPAPLFDADRRYLLRVDGLSNPRQTATLERTLEALESVDRVRRDSNKGIVTLFAGRRLSRQVASRAVRAVGLELRSFEAASNTSGTAGERR